MNCSTPRYVLFAEAIGIDPGSWRFVLRSPDGSGQIEAADVEPKVRGDRLDLLTLVRALESLDQPSEVTLVGCTRYIRQGLQYGLAEWRENGWRWEFFGDMVPVKNGDLWQRLDRALRFHHLECCRHRVDPPHQTQGEPIRPPHVETDTNPVAEPIGVSVVQTKENRGGDVELGIRVADRDWVRYEESRISGGFRRLVALVGDRVVRWWTTLLSRGRATRNRGAPFLGKTA